MVRKYVLLSLLMIKVCFLFAQNEETSLKYVKDFDYLCKKLENTHPNIYYNISLKEYEEWKIHIRHEISNINNNTDFILLASEFLAKINDSHTQMLSMPDEEAFPILIQLYNNKFYVVAAESKDLSGYEITHINHTPIDTVVEILGKYVGAETELCKKCMLIYLMRSPTFIKLINNNIADSTMCIQTENGMEFSMKAQSHCHLKSDSIFYSIYISCQRDFWYELDTVNSICLFHFNSFSDLSSKLENAGKKYMSQKKLQKMAVGEPLFSKYLTKMFQDILDHNIQNLVIDMRYNMGGNSLLGDQLLKFLTNDETINRLNTLCSTSKYPTDELYIPSNKVNNFMSPNDSSQTSSKKKASKNIFNNPRSIWNIDKIIPFNGKTYALVGNSTYSSAADLAFILSKLGVTIVGDMMPQVIDCFGDIVLFTTPYSHLQFGISCQYFYDKVSTFKDNVLHPTIYIPYDYKDLREGHDKPYEWILEDVNNNIKKN